MSEYYATKRVYVGPDCNELDPEEELSITTQSEVPGGFREVDGWQYSHMGSFNTIEDARAYAIEKGWKFDSIVHESSPGGGDGYEMYWRSAGYG